MNIQGPVVVNPLPNQAPPLPLSPANWLSAFQPFTNYSQTLGGGRANISLPKSPGTLQAGFPAGQAQGGPFAMVVVGGGTVNANQPKSSPSARFGAPAKPYPISQTGAGPGNPAGASVISGGGAALFRGVVGVDGDLVVWGTIYNMKEISGQHIIANAESGPAVQKPVPIGAFLTFQNGALAVAATTAGVTQQSAVASITAGSQQFQNITGGTVAMTGSTVTVITAVGFDTDTCSVTSSTTSVFLPTEASFSPSSSTVTIYGSSLFSASTASVLAGGSAVTQILIPTATT